MKRRILSICSIVALLVTLLAAPGAVGAASGLSVAPQAGAPGTQFVVTASGLTPGTQYRVLVERGMVFSQTYDVTGDAQGRVRLTVDSTGFVESTNYGAIIFPAAGGSPLGSTQFTVQGNQAERCFAETGFCVRGRFLAYWDEHGGLAINGFPLSDEFSEVLEDGKPYVVQYFERTRLEYHPESADPLYQVQLGQFGRRIHGADPRAEADPTMVWVPETGHNVPNDLYSYWTMNGGLAQFGYPLTEVIIETLDGKQYRVQYFERARFEYHPENPAPYNILLGQFGRIILAQVVR